MTNETLERNKKDVQYRWSIKTDNVYQFGFRINRSMTLASYKNEVSGFVKKSDLPSLLNDLRPFGYSFNDKNIKLVTIGNFWKNWAKYH